MKQLNKAFLGIGLVCSVAFCMIMYWVIYSISESFAVANPKIAFMRTPLLVFSMLAISGVVAALCLTLYLVYRSTKENIFKRTTIKALYRIGHCLAFTCLISLMIYGYSYYFLQSKVGLLGGYMLVFTLIAFVGTNLLYFLAGLFKEAVEYKEENQLTV